MLSVLDPRAWLHGLKILSYYNTMNVRERRRMTVGHAPHISPLATFANGRNITLGDRVRIGAHCALWAGPGRGRIVLGDDCMLGPNVMITASNYRYDEGQPVSDQAMREADVVLGRDVWLGASVILLPGVRLGDGCVVAAGAVVRGAFPDMSILAGNPAQMVGTREVAET